MQLFDVIDDDNFLLYASHVYQNPQAHTVEEFYDDLNRFKYIRRLFKRYYEDGDLKERLILNHIIVIYNVFGMEGGHKLIFFKVDRDYWPALKTFLIYLQYLPDNALPHIPLDQRVVSKLRKI